MRKNGLISMGQRSRQPSAPAGSACFRPAKWLAAILLSLVLNGPFTSAFAEPLPDELKQAQQAFQNGQYQSAMEILVALEATQAGVIEFDYLYGRTALELGDLNTAIAAFSRVLSLAPDLPGARLELARTYYSKGVVEHSRGSFEQARAEFKNVLDQNPPALIKTAITDYLVTIDKYLEVRHFEKQAFAEITAGYDTNVNNAPSTDHFAFFDIFSSSVRDIEVFEGSQRIESWYGSVKAGANITLPLFSRYFDLFGSMTVGANTIGNAHQFDNLFAHMQFGAHHYGDSNKKTFSLNFIDRDMDGRRYADEFYLNLEWAEKIDDYNMFTARMAGGDLNYEGEYWPRSVNGGRFGFEWTYLANDSNKSTYQLLILRGGDGMQRCDTFCNAPFKREIHGMRFAIGKNMGQQSRLYTSLLIENSEYSESFFTDSRDDARYELFVGIDSRINNKWQIRPELHMMYNDSTIPLYSYKRTTASISLRWSI